MHSNNFDEVCGKLRRDLNDRVSPQRFENDDR
jgi:hypothetical protein